MDMRIDETGRHPAAAAVDDLIELTAILPREYVCCKTDIGDTIVNDRDCGVANDGVVSIDSQREFEVLDESTHGESHPPLTDVALLCRAAGLLNLNEIVGIRDIGE